MLGETTKLSIAAGLTVIDAVLVPVPSVPVNVPTTTESTPLVLTENVAEVAPAGTVTETGT